METANRAFPKELNFNNTKPLGHVSKPQILRYRSDYSTAVGNPTTADKIRIEIPTGGSNQYLFPKDTFLEGKIQLSGLKNTAATNVSVNIDQSVYSLFSRMQIIHGSTVIEDCSQVGRLWTALNDIQINTAERAGQTLTHLVQDATILTEGGTNNHGTLGKQFWTYGAVAAGVGLSSDTFNFCFVIPSGVIGSLASKALPLGLIGNSSLFLELELATFNDAFVSMGASFDGTSAKYTLSDIYLNAKVATLDNDVNKILINSFGGSAINLPAVSYITDLKTIGASTSNFNDKFAFQYSSLKNFLFFVYRSASANSITQRSISSRPRANIQEYYLTINGEAYPSQSIQSYSRMYSELVRAFDGLTDTNYGGIINYTNYTDDSTLVASDTLTDSLLPYKTAQRRFIAGIDLDRFNHSSDVFMSGTSCIGQMVNLNLNFVSGNANEALTLVAAVQYDVLYRIENGQMTHKF